MVCAVPLQLCVNNRDPRLPACFPGGVSVVDIRWPDAGSSDPIELANLGVLQRQFDSNGFGITVYRHGSLTEVGSPLGVPDRCSGEFVFTVPVRPTQRGPRPGTRRVRLQITSTSGFLDSDRLTLQCRPSP